MDVIESWQDHNNNNYAIVKHSEKDQKDYRIREYEACSLMKGQLTKTVSFRLEVT